MTIPRTGYAARLLYRDRHRCTGTWWTVISPEGVTYELCSGVCLVSFAVYGALPADVQAVVANSAGTTENVA